MKKIIYLPTHLENRSGDSKQNDSYKITFGPSVCTMDHPDLTLSMFMEILLITKCKIWNLPLNMEFEKFKDINNNQARLFVRHDFRVASSIPVRHHTFVEIDHEIISPPFYLFKKGCQLQAKICASKYWLIA